MEKPEALTRRPQRSVSPETSNPCASSFAFTAGSACAALAASVNRLKTSSGTPSFTSRSEEHTSELQSRQYLVCRLLLEKKKKRMQLKCYLYLDICMLSLSRL